MSKIKIYEEKENIPYEEITKVLNLAYKELLDQSLSYAAATQTVESTNERWSLHDSRNRWKDCRDFDISCS